MINLFPKPITQMPRADIPFAGSVAYLSQGEDHQILFMYFEEEVELKEHFHAAQWGIVLEGRIELCIGGERNIYQKGDRYFIPENIPHSGRIFAGYADMTYFAQKDRYAIKQG